jgi:hypothetical protein
MLALLSIVVALVGAFTIVGSAAAVLVGIASLVQLRQRRGRLIGARLALCAIILGLGCAGLTVVLFGHEVLPIAAWMRQHTTAAPADSTGSLELITRDSNVILRRPSHTWGRVPGDQSDDSAVGELQQKRELLLSHLREHAFIDVARITGLVHLNDMIEPLAKDLQTHRSPLLGEEEDARGQPGYRPLYYAERPKEIDSIGPWEGRQCVVDFSRGGQTWRMLVRFYKKAEPASREPAYMLRAYSPRRRFAALRQELEDVLSSAQLPK